MQLLQAEAPHPDSWLQGCHEDVQMLVRGSLLPSSAAVNFLQGFLDFAAYESRAVARAVRRARHADGSGCGSLFPCVTSHTATHSESFACSRCQAALDTHQQLTAHEFAAHGVHSDAELFLGSTHCVCCRTQFWSKARLRRHLVHDKPSCLRALRDHNLARPSSPLCNDIASKDRGSLPAFRLHGPVQPGWPK